MNLQYVVMPLGRLPLRLQCLSNGRVAILAHGLAYEVLDIAPDGVSAHFHKEGYNMYTDFRKEEYSYGEHIEYKSQPLLLAWLKQQNLVNPYPKEDT